MNIVQAVVLGVVEGVTEFLPVSSTGHLTIVEKLMGLPLDDAGVTAFTAIIQTGAIIAVIVYFRRDMRRWPRCGCAAPATNKREPTRSIAWHGR